MRGVARLGEHGLGLARVYLECLADFGNARDGHIPDRIRFQLPGRLAQGLLRPTPQTGQMTSG